MVKHVRASQRNGSKLADIFYDVEDGDGNRLDISVEIQVWRGFWEGPTAETTRITAGTL
ncbi:MAG: hypothetical protein WC340_05505 [Kiritimatiellia bacterium]